MRDPEIIDCEVRLLAAVRGTIRAEGPRVAAAVDRTDGRIA